MTTIKDRKLYYLCAYLIVGILVIGVFCSTASAQLALPTGEWKINGNGFKGTLRILSVDIKGNLVGSIKLGSEPIQPVFGFYDKDSGKITFVRVINKNDSE